ncbi:MAG: hypothetical protein HFF98_02390 [Oscillibacter sp.]|jgi:DNA-binding SARP family transcriptional activator|nr:hypothetical protein [Oscillibacter sp.]
MELQLLEGRRGVEQCLIRRWLAHAEHLTLLAVEVPLLSDLPRAAAAFLRERGDCLSFRIKTADAADRERLTRLLKRSWCGAPDASGVLDAAALAECLPESDRFLLISHAEHLNREEPLGLFLEDLLLSCGEQLHIVLTAEGPIPFLEQLEELPRLSASVGPGALALEREEAEKLLENAYPSLTAWARQTAFRLSGGWISGLDALAAQLVGDSGSAAHRTIDEQSCFPPELGDLLARWTASWPLEQLECLEKLCVCTAFSSGLAERLTGGSCAPLYRLAAEGFPVRGPQRLDAAYTLNPMVQTWLYHRTREIRGQDFLLEQHRLAAAMGLERQDWMEVFRHQLHRGRIEEASRMLRYLSFSELDAALLEEYRDQLRRQSPGSMNQLPWVQLGYAIAMKYRHPNIAFRSLRRALELFQAAGERAGVVLVCCQQISMGFFASEQRDLLQNALCILAEEHFDADELDPLLEGYRRVFTAYAALQQERGCARAIDLLEQAREIASVLDDANLRLWTCFVLVLTYRQDTRYAGGLTAVLDEAMVLVEQPEVQKPLKMCFYQTVAFLYFVEGGRYGEACACCEQATRIADAIGAVSYSVYINMTHAYALDCLGRFSRAEQVILETARRCGSVLSVRNEHLWAYYLIGQSYHYFMKGDWGLALETAEKAATYATRSGSTSYVARSQLVLGNILADHGVLDQAEEAARRCLEVCGEREKYRFYILSAQFLQVLILSRRNEREAFETAMARLAAGSRAAGIYHYNFTKPSSICRVVREYRPQERDKRFFAQIEAYNDLELRPAETPILAEARPDTPLEVRLLGPLQVFSGGRELALCSSARAGLLLRLLALDGGAVSIHKLLEAIWPEWEEKSATNSFYFTLHQLRTYLGRKDAVTYRRGQCALNPELVTVDAALFHKLAENARAYLRAGDLYAARRYYDQALLLCRGPVLDGDDLMGDAQLQQEDMERMVHAVMRECGAVCLRQRRPDKAERVLTRAMSSPFADEGTVRLFIRAQYLIGDKRGALSTYERLCRQLQEELGVEPHRRTHELADRIRRNQELTDLSEE